MEEEIEGSNRAKAPAALVARVLFSGAGLAALVVLSRLFG